MIQSGGYLWQSWLRTSGKRKRWRPTLAFTVVISRCRSGSRLRDRLKRRWWLRGSKWDCVINDYLDDLNAAVTLF